MMDYFKKNNKSFSENPDVIKMKNLLHAYSLVIKDQLYDFIPKCIISLYINDLVDVAD